MDELLECTKCGNEVDQILALQCEHNLCLPCSAKLHSKLQSQTLICEICSIQTLLDPTAVEVLIDMARMGNSRISLKSSRHQQQQQQIQTNIQVTCQQHVSEEAILYCYTCETPCFCMECYLQGLHKNHEVKNVQKSYTVLKTTKAEQIYQKVKASQDQLLQDQCKFVAKKKQLLEINAQTKMQIQQIFQELFKALQLKEVELIQVADDTVSEKMKEIDQEMQRISTTMEKLGDVLSDIDHYFPDHPDQSSAISAFNYVASNNRKIETITRGIMSERQIWSPQIQVQYTLDPQSIIQQVEDIRATKLKIMTLRGLETVEPTNYERTFYEKAREERTKRLFQFSQEDSQNKENMQNANQNGNQNLSFSQIGMSDFEKKFQEAKRCLTQRRS